MRKEKKMGKNSCYGGHGSGCMFYLLGFLGALWFNVSTAAGFGAGVLGVLKAFVWPAFLIYDLLKFMA